MYELVQELVAHQGDVRSICVLPSTEPGNDNAVTVVTGARDRLAKLWKASKDGKSYTEVKILYNHEHWVSAAMTLPDGGFVTGCQDKKIRRFDSSGELIAVAEGHEGPVTSLSLNPKTGELISGSWDGTARLWDISGTGIQHSKTLSGHENGVCVLGLPNGAIATGSAGVANNGIVAGYQIRMWQNGSVVKSLHDHESAIRCLALGSDGTSFFSTSNDGSTRQWSLDGSLIQTLRNPHSNDGTCAFSFSVAVNESTGEVLTANDDCCVRVWGESGLVQQIDHPCTVWWVTALTNGDIATGGADGFVRVFSQSEDRKADPAIRDYYIEETSKSLAAMAQKSGGGNSIDVSKLPKIEDAKAGTTPGQVKMFNKQGVAWVYSWSAESSTWIEVGEAMGEAGQGPQEIDGVKYDKVLDVEIEEPGIGIRKLKLGINNGENPYGVAQEFINKHGLRYENLEQIVNYINQNRGSTTPTIDLSGTQMDDVIYGKGEDGERKRPLDAQFPLQTITGYAFESAKLSKVLDKLNEFNEEVQDSLKLNMQELSTLESLIEILEKKNRYHASTFTRMHMTVLDKLVTWDLEHLFPVFDLIRMLFTHPAGAKSLGENRCKAILLQCVQLAAQEIQTPKEKPQLAILLTTARTLANIFRHAKGSEFAVHSLMSEEGIELFAQPLRLIIPFENKSVRLALATIYLNSANALFHLEQNSPDLYSILTSSALELADIAIQSSEAETTRRCLAGIGTILLGSGSLEGVPLESVSAVLDSASSMKPKDEKLDQCVRQLEEALKNHKKK